ALGDGVFGVCVCARACTASHASLTTLSPPAALPISALAAAGGAFARYIVGEHALQPWTLVTYGLLHGSWMHVIFNSVWLAAFGAPVARRCGALRWCVLALAGPAGGRRLHIMIDPSSAGRHRHAARIALTACT
ncbi:rhomboid family intramembrane serine protease, partial [Methylobacterium radiotolerans]|uniref:rhomboid family intramembrane serine protease n=1 Tax=Methylobacterium radiotolerans TaxID=31998 RepID=UPI003F661E0E